MTSKLILTIVNQEKNIKAVQEISQEEKIYLNAERKKKEGKYFEALTLLQDESLLAKPEALAVITEIMKEKTEIALVYLTNLKKLNLRKDLKIQELELELLSKK